MNARIAMAFVALCACTGAEPTGSTDMSTSDGFADMVPQHDAAVDQESSVDQSSDIDISEDLAEPDMHSEPVSLTFHSTWSTGTGSDNEALQDGGLWDENFCISRHDVLSVIPGADLDWTRTPNIFAIEQQGEGQCGAIQVRDVVPPATSHWGRMYVRNDDVIWDGAMHNASYNFVGDIHLVFFNLRGNEDGWRFNINVDYAEDGIHWNFKPLDDLAEWRFNYWSLRDNHQADELRLPNFQWFRYEWHIEYISDEVWRIWPRLYDMDGGLIFDATDLYHEGVASQYENLADFYAQGRGFGYAPENGRDLMRHIGLGNEGRGSSPNTGQRWYHADFAISLDGWIGDR